MSVMHRKIAPEIQSVKRVTPTFYELVREQQEDQESRDYREQEHLQKSGDNANSTNLEGELKGLHLATDDFKCYVCFTNPSCIVYVDCMHGGICKTCCQAVINAEKKCSLCRKPITSLIELEHQHGNVFKVVAQIVLFANNH